MRTLHKVILFEPNTILAGRMASYWSELENASFAYEIYTLEEQFWTDLPRLEADVWLLDEFIYHKLVATDKSGVILNFTPELQEDTEFVFKYQSIHVITSIIEEQLGISANAYTTIGSKLYALYSPSSPPIETAIALELAQLLARTHQTLYIQLKPYSDLEYRTHQTFTKDISDLLFYLENNTNQSPSKIRKHMTQFGAMDILVAPKHIENLMDISAQQWMTLLETIAYSYECIVIELSNSVRGVHTLLERAQQIITCIPCGDTYNRTHQTYLENLEHLGESHIIKNSMTVRLEEGACMGGYTAQAQYIRQYRVMDKVFEEGVYGNKGIRGDLSIS